MDVGQQHLGADARVAAAGQCAVGRPDLPLALTEHGRMRQLARGDSLMRGADAARSLYVVESGALKLSLLSPDGDELVVGLFFDGDVLGLQRLGDANDGDVATALEATRVREIPLATLRQLSRQSPSLQHQLFRLASQRIAQLQRHMLVLGKKRALERVAGFIIDLAVRRAGPDGSVRVPLSLYGIGSYLGLSFETVCRLLRQLEQAGAIRRKGRMLTILDRHMLTTLSEPSGADTARDDLVHEWIDLKKEA